MTNILIYRRPDGLLTGYRVNGHTGYAPAGEDIVCSAISFLSITCANALESIAGQAPKVQEVDGYLEVRIPSPNEKASTILKVFEQGALDLENSYKRYVELIYSD